MGHRPDRGRTITRLSPAPRLLEGWKAIFAVTKGGKLNAKERNRFQRTLQKLVGKKQYLAACRDIEQAYREPVLVTRVDEIDLVSLRVKASRISR